MGIEIERKFLLAGDGWRALGTPLLLRQGYLSADPDRVVRVRVAGQHAFLTIKGRSVGATRGEWEYPVPLADANALLDTLCVQPLIEKFRREIVVGGHTWEVDEFLGANLGLVVAEIELASEDTPFERPDWIGAEVTHEPRYFNSSLVRQPYASWR